MNNIQLGINKLLKDKPFYAHFFLNSRIIFDYPGVSTAVATLTKTGPMFLFNREFMESLTPDQVVGIIEHETLHMLFEHTLVMTKSDKNHRAMNVAMDCAINQYIRDLPEGAVTVSGLEKILKIKLEHFQNWEYYFTHLMNYVDELEANGLNSIDEHGVEHPDKVSNTSEAKGALNNALKKAVKSSAGNVPRELHKLIDSLSSDETLPWQTILANFISRCTSSSTRNTRKKRNRRFGVSVPGRVKKRELRLAVCVDSSGSVSDESFTSFMNEISRIVDVANTTYVIDADCEVHNVEKLNKSKKPTMQRHGYGGTAYQPAINKAMELKCDAIIYFGDMDVSDSPTDPGVPFLWVIVGPQNPPADFGYALRLGENF